MHGEERANRVYRLCYDAIPEMGKIARSLDGDCGFEFKKSIYLASQPRDADDLKEEVRLRHRIGIRCDYLDERAIGELFPFRRPGAILSYDAGQLNPIAFTQLLLARCAQRGLRLYEHTGVTEHAPTHDGVRLTTDTGQVVRALHAVFATGYEGVPDPPLTVTQTTYVVESQPMTSLDGWWERALIWETARPYFYLRTTSDGHVILGGEDDDGPMPPSPATFEKKSRILRRKFNELFPALDFRPAATWAGVFKSSRDGLPFIGPRSDYPNSYFVLGYGGNGMTFSLIGAKIIADLCSGKSNDYVDLFSFDRRIE